MANRAPWENAVDNLKACLDIRRKGYLKEDGLYPLFFDVLANAAPIADVIEEEFNRDKLYEEIQDLVGKAQFRDWLPPKIKLNFVAAFSRDAFISQRTRLQNYGVAAGKDAYKMAAIDDLKDALKKL
jgi:hypothetical protein